MSREIESYPGIGVGASGGTLYPSIMGGMDIAGSGGSLLSAGPEPDHPQPWS